MGIDAVDRDDLRRRFDVALDRLEGALRTCPDGRWTASVWPVPKTDPWVWPAPGVAPIPERTEESIQQFSAFWVVAYHCLWFLDFYAGLAPGFESPEYVRGGPEELPWPTDGAAPLPDRVFGRDVLLRYLEHGRDQIRRRLTEVTDAQLAEVCPEGHPWGGATLAQLLEVNVRHVEEHGAQLAEFADRS